MTNGLDGYFGIHVKALALREARSTQLATNLANVDTPNYKAKDIDFEQSLKEAMQLQPSSSMEITNPNHINTSNSFTQSTQYRIPNHTSLDGNTVDKDLEISEFSKNSMGYQASLSFLDGKIKSIMLAIRGE